MFNPFSIQFEEIPSCAVPLVLNAPLVPNKRLLTWGADYEKPMRIGCKQGKMRLNCFYL
jgi:hypothetical protein